LIHLFIYSLNQWINESMNQSINSYFIPSPSSLILALDVGTSSVRAAFYDEHGDEVAGTEVRCPRGFNTTEDGGAELDAEQAVEQAVRAIDKTLAQSAGL